MYGVDRVTLRVVCLWVGNIVEIALGKAHTCCDRRGAYRSVIAGRSQLGVRIYAEK